MARQDPIPKAIIQHALQAVCCCAMCLALKEAEDEGDGANERAGSGRKTNLGALINAL